MTNDEIIDLIDRLRARGVQAIRLKRDGDELELAGIPPLRANEVPESPDARKALLENPDTPESLKNHLAELDERDLFEAST